MNETLVENAVRKYLEKEGWILTNFPRKVGEHGIDIKARHPKWKKTYIIEAKGEGRSSKEQIKHSAFWTLIGQIISRMDREGNSSNRSRYYGIAIPKNWEKTFRNKISKMKFGWELLKLHVFLVDNNGKVEEKSYSYFLRN